MNPSLAGLLTVEGLRQSWVLTPCPPCSCSPRAYVSLVSQVPGPDSHSTWMVKGEGNCTLPQEVMQAPPLPLVVGEWPRP